MRRLTIIVFALAVVAAACSSSDDTGVASLTTVGQESTTSTTSSTSDEQALIEFCHEHLARYKCPRSVDFEAQLPRLPTGKLYKRLLRDRYWGKTGSSLVS